MLEGRWDRLRETAGVLEQRAAAARQGAAGVPGGDRTGAVVIGLDVDGRVDVVEVAADWRRKVQAGLPEAVHDAFAAAVTARAGAWGKAISDPGPSAATPAEPSAGSAEFAGRLQEAATARLTVDSGEVVARELLALLHQIEQGLDEAAAALEAAARETVLGRSPAGRATISLTGRGELREVRYDQRWLLHAHATDISRQTLAGFRDAYAALDAGAAAQTLPGPLGAAQRAVHDPVELARRLHLSD